MVVFVAFFVLQKLVFMLYYHQFMQGASFSDHISVLYQGLPMDLSVAGYLTIIPAILIIIGLWTRSHWPGIVMKVYFAVVSMLVALITILDLELYGYWGFRLDTTPLFYFTTSPSAALASATTHQIFIGIIAIAVIAYGLYLAFVHTVCRISPSYSHPLKATIAMILLTAALFIPIRGGITVSTMNPSRAYFSPNKFFNHAAVNPAFNLLYSATHQNDIAGSYRFMTEDEAIETLQHLSQAVTPTTTDSVTAPQRLLGCTNPDIYLVILESFSAHLLPSLGGENIAEGLDSVARSGVSFTHFYANSFRTDRALPSILSGLPAQPSMSILKYVDKTERLPSIARELKKAGYSTAYYYGGDVNFANINAYLVSAGYDRIIRDTDFPITDRQSKWGAHDHQLFNRVLDDLTIRPATSATPIFTVIQTSSSHEPFEVPFCDPRFESQPQKNAFVYTDYCLRDFLENIKKSPRYGCTLVVIVPDHLGAWPLDLPEAAERHHVPLVLTGGALAPDAPRTIATPGSQNDIAATLLGLLGLDTTAFPFSNDLLDPHAPHYAVFTEPSLIGIITENDTIIYNADAGIVEKNSGSTNATLLENSAKAYLQTLYQNLSKL